MEIKIGKTAGFCYGVKKAIEGAQKDLLESEELYCLGEIVHNKRVTGDLENKGLKIVEDIRDVDKKTVIRAHGIPKEVYQYAKDNNIELKDYTCYNVKKIHEIAKEYAQKCFYIILCGNNVHPENIGTMSYCGENYINIENVGNIDNVINKIKESKIKDILLISQTTFSLKLFKEIESELLKKMSKEYNIIINNTICKATEIRQKETEELSKEVDIMIIIGGKNSSNTKKLYEIAKRNLEESICIEDKAELNVEEFKKYEKIGIMAGASTPKESIDEVVDMLKNNIL